MTETSEFLENFNRAFSKEPHVVAKSDILALIQHPNFQEASTHARTLLTGCFQRNVGRHDISLLSTSVIHTLIVYFNYQRKLTRQQHGRTLTTLRDWMESKSIISGRQVLNVVDRLVDMGRVVREHNPLDRRMKWLVPTPAMIEACSELMLSVILPLEAFGVPADVLDRLKSDIGLQEAVIYTSAKKWMTANEPVSLFNAVRMMITKQRGLALLSTLALETTRLHGSIFAEEPIPFSISAAADENRVSRSHMRLLLETLRQHGYLIAQGSTREITVTKKLAMELECSLAIAFLGHRQALEEGLSSYELMSGSAPLGPEQDWARFGEQPEKYSAQPWQE